MQTVGHVCRPRLCLQIGREADEGLGRSGAGNLRHVTSLKICSELSIIRSVWSRIWQKEFFPDHRMQHANPRMFGRAIRTSDLPLAGPVSP